MLRKLSIVLLAACLTTFSLTSNASAIENGNDASSNDFTVFIVSTWNSSSISTCSGALLNEYVVVTAAHCINDETGLISKSIKVMPPGNAIVYSSDDKIIPQTDWVEADSTQVTLTYQSGSKLVTNDDLAFLTLKTPLKSNPLVRIASEDEMSKLKASSAPLKVYGYGYISDAGKRATSPNYMNAEFENSSHPLVNSAYARSASGNACSGDSGGPVVNITPSQITVVGVTTGADLKNKCSNKGNDGFYHITFTLLNRYANLAFATTSKIASNLNGLSTVESELSTKKEELDSAKSRIAELEAELEKISGDYSDLQLQLDSLKTENEILKSKLPRTISCIKGSTLKKITGVTPKCPTGYKLKV